MEKKSRQLYDWDQIEREWRTNQFSDAELARRHGCSRGAIQKRRDKHCWVRDLSDDVRVLANARLVKEDAYYGLGQQQVAGEVTGCHLGAKDHDRREVELAAETRVEVVRQHRRTIKMLQQLEDELIEKLTGSPIRKATASYMGEISTADVELSPAELAVAYNQLVSAATRRMDAERKAFNLDDKGRPDDALPLVLVHDPTRILSDVELGEGEMRYGDKE